MTDQVNADWTELQVTIPAADTDRAGDIAQMVVPYGIYIEDYSHLEEEAMEIAHIDLIDEDLLKKDRTKSIIHVYISPEENPAEAISFLKERFEAVGIENTITAANCAEEDWINNWKKFFSSFYIEDILIKPTWEELKEEDKDKFLIEIDPGVSFGTGKHETTQLCIRQLLKYIRGNAEYTPENKTPKVLDVGCGSGILSIVALKLGASEVVGTDLDPDCMTSTHENFEVNHLDSRLGTFYVGNLIDDVELQEKVGTEEYDIVVANILADVIIPMAPVIPARLKKGGYFITSGIIDFKEDQVKEAIEKAGLTVVEINHQGEWVNITAQKR